MMANGEPLKTMASSECSDLDGEKKGMFSISIYIDTRDCR